MEDLFSDVYAEKTVTHIFSGKAIARALRAHVLAESVLNSLLLLDIKEKCKIDFTDLQDYLRIALTSELDTEKLNDLNSDITLNLIQNELENKKNELKEQFRTARLWIQYMDYVNIFKHFIYAERTSNWELHLSSLSNMLNLFAATMQSVGDCTSKTWKNSQKVNPGFMNNSKVETTQFGERVRTGLAYGLTWLLNKPLCDP